MSTPVRADREDDAGTPPAAASPPPTNAASLKVTQDLPLISAELTEALLVEQATLRTEVLLWQRWVRYVALGALVLLTVVFGSTEQNALPLLAVLAVAYVAVVAATAHALEANTGAKLREWFPSLLLTADILTISGFMYLTSPPEQMSRVLMFGFLSVQLAVFYFGRRHGTIAAVLTALAYLVFTVAVPPYVLGPRPTPLGVSFNVALFAILATVLVYTFGSFRERMDSLRMYCKVVERGEVATLPRLGAERWPDELTLLARSFQAMHVRMAEQIGSDPLTGCMNRRTLEAKLRSDLRQARRRGSSVAVAAIDLDHFKEINDSTGHLVGDIVLQQLAGIMKATARDTDCVARFGGDEFVIVLPDTGWQGALTFAERLRRRVDDFAFGPPGSPMDLTISVGVALARGSDTVSSDTLLRDADTALYKAKTAGRNRVFS